MSAVLTQGEGTMSENEKMAVMFSIRPAYCSLIMEKQKTCELRKTAPKQSPPYKGYIYCTMGKKKLLDIVRDGDEYYGHIHHGKTEFITMPECDYLTVGKRGKVIGEFICDADAPITFDADGVPTLHYDGPIKDWRTCVSAKAAREYCRDTEKRGLWALHISELKIYDEPKELKEFNLRRPFQSWGYVYEIN